MRRNSFALIVISMLFALACSRTAEPEFEAEDGMVVLRFEPPATAVSAASSGGAPAAVFDSVIVRVFRPGTPIVMEKWQGAQVGVDPVEMSLSCVAENNKRISVELFYSGLLTHHGANVDVDVVAGANTPVTVDASKFYVDALSVTPSVVSDPTPFDLSWTSAPAADWYHLQASTQPNFAVIEWEQNVTDTIATATLPPGMHYLRVIPKTDFATGLRTGPEGGYVTGGSGTPLITGFSAPEVIPGETVTILGENLDVPGTQAWIGSGPSQEMPILSSSWGALLVRVPRGASTDVVAVSSPLPPGGAIAPELLIVQRVAYVTAGGEFADEYREDLFDYRADFGYSGVAVVPVTDLDAGERDMGVFDVVIVANDTGTTEDDWGGDPSRATAIAASTANVLAIGEGGLAFLRVVSAVGDAAQYQTNQTSYYTDTPSSTIYTTPHSVTGGGGAQWIDICQNPGRTHAIEIRSPVPAGVSLDACTGLNCPLLCSPNERWSLVEFQVPDVFSAKKTYVFFGYGDDPKLFTKQGGDLLGNMMHLLYNERSVAPPVEAAQR